MLKINWARLLIGTIIATAILFVTDGFFHERVVGLDWQAVYSRLGIAPPEHSGAGVLYFLVFEIGRGFLSIFLYSLMRKSSGPGAKTAAFAGIVAWVAFSLTGPAQFIPLGFFSTVLWIKAGLFQLVTSVVAAIAGAAVYKEA